MAPKLAATAPGSDRLKRQLFIYAAPKQTVRSRPNSGHYDETNFMISTAPSNVSLFFTQSQIRLPRHAVM